MGCTLKAQPGVAIAGEMYAQPAIRRQSLNQLVCQVNDCTVGLKLDECCRIFRFR